MWGLLLPGVLSVESLAERNCWVWEVIGMRGTIETGVVDVVGREEVDEERRCKGSKNRGVGGWVRLGCGSVSSLADFLCLAPVRCAKVVLRALLACVRDSSIVAEHVTSMPVKEGGGCVEVLALSCEGLVDVLGWFGLGLAEVDG